MKQKSKTKLLIIYLVLLIAITGSLYSQKTNRDIPNLNNYNFGNYEIGNLNFEKPVSFEFKKIEAAKNKAVLSDETFRYDRKNLFLNIDKIKYRDQVDFNIESVYLQRKNHYSQADNISDVKVLNNNYKINNRPAIEYKVYFNPNDGTSLVQKGLVIRDQQTLFLIEFIYKQQAANAEELSDKIIDSMRFTK